MLPTSKHFSPENDKWLYFCHDGTPYPEEWSDRFEEKLTMLEKIRVKWQNPIIDVSGYRSPAWNKFLIERDKKKGTHGVVSGSQHCEGRADDIRPMNRIEVPQLYKMILGMHENGLLPELGGIGIYPISGWVHVDTHRVDHLRKWTGT
jgi:uncharacterized protein YcbK (DUF882 family)